MKKRDLWTGVGMVTGGLLFLLTALLQETPLDGLFWGLFGAFTGPGVMQLFKYVKWTRPKNIPIYQALLEQEKIDLHDERNSMLRDKSGRYAYVFGLATLTVAVFAFSILEMLGIIDKAEGRLVTLFLAFDLIVQYIAGIVFYHRMARKY